MERDAAAVRQLRHVEHARKLDKLRPCPPSRLGTGGTGRSDPPLGVRRPLLPSACRGVPPGLRGPGRPLINCCLAGAHGQSAPSLMQVQLGRVTRWSVIARLPKPALVGGAEVAGTWRRRLMLGCGLRTAPVVRSPGSGRGHRLQLGGPRPPAPRPVVQERGLRGRWSWPARRLLLQA